MRDFFSILQFVPLPIWLLYFFLIGTIIGSFLNVCIYRIPLKKSIVRPRSRCTGCERTIPWYYNIPILSYLWLRGRCKYCGSKISLMYPLVELLTGVYCVLLLHYYGLSIPSLVYLVFGCAVIVLIFIDYNHKLLPAVITFPGVALGFASSFINPLLNPAQSALGILVGGLIPIAVLLGYQFIRKKEGLGHGDIVMLAMVGAFLGWQKVFLVILFSSLAGAVLGILIVLLMKKDSDYMLPYGTFIGATTLLAVFWGRWIWHMYVRL